MKFTAVLSLATAATAIQVNYYTDGGCTQFNTSPPNVPTDGSCYQYQFSGTNSANVANCDHSVCECIFYTGANCQGAQDVAISPGDNCASNYGPGFQSFRCVVTG
ncbi:uncharacterized protein F4807DRAFT_464009 [Annulohypoxylon truncatum]|uniref:uncharacterized protein n=1 Tax=Annulohypoxylon truncatum TaxID=327061 RepID=UPI00200721BC|nr:uncharacterized protein F4807DRAFT_464009 [Annulohypoxylon truncatum]KAI1206001.1 hypothetical protein F4807DRAFT_464009 [Annulohypoxylon truncatum]